jgi:hypothetical protein
MPTKQNYARQTVLREEIAKHPGASTQEIIKAASARGVKAEASHVFHARSMMKKLSPANGPGRRTAAPEPVQPTPEPETVPIAEYKRVLKDNRKLREVLTRLLME